MEEAERIAREEHGSVKLAVISGNVTLLSASNHPVYSSLRSGVGTRDYYRKLGYTLDGPYMSKILELSDETEESKMPSEPSHTEVNEEDNDPWL